MMKNPVLKISIFNSVYKFFRESTTFFLAMYLVQIGLSGGQIGIVFALANLTGIIATLPSGIINDKIRSKHLISLAILFVAMQFVGISNYHSFLIVLILFLLGGIGKTLFSISMDSLFYKSSGKKDSPMKIATMLMPNYLMLGAGTILTGYLINFQINFEQLFLIIGILLAILSVIGLIILPKSATANLSILDYKNSMSDPKAIFLLTIMSLFAIHFGAEDTSYGLFLKTNLGLNPNQMGIYMGTAIMVMGFSVLWIGKNFSKIKVKNLLLYGLFLSGTFHILMTIQNPYISWSMRVIHEIGDSMMFFALLFGISQLFDEKKYGGLTGIFTFSMVISATFGAFIFGYIGGNFGYNVPIIIGGLTTLIAFIITCKFTHLIHEEHRPNRS
ncbi:MAG: MFS transporter [Candidatus Gracilibacteria bacterium]|jgi:MFS family permease